MKRDYNSNTNQDIKGKFVGQHIKTCFSYEMDSIFKAGQSYNDHDLPSYEDVENMYYFDDDIITDKVMREFQFEGEKMIAYANDPDTFNRRCKTEGDFRCFLVSLNEEELEELCNAFAVDIDEEKSTPHEIFEWWIVTKYLYQKLKEEGCPVLEWGNNYYWGRCTTGQAILLDHIISVICEEMEILEDQKYSWEGSF